MLTGPEESLICIACLNKDMTSKVELFRANSIRVLSKIMDGSMVYTLYINHIFVSSLSLFADGMGLGR
jgi:vesicle coat complex subunit